MRTAIRHPQKNKNDFQRLFDGIPMIPFHLAGIGMPSIPPLYAKLVSKQKQCNTYNHPTQSQTVYH